MVWNAEINTKSAAPGPSGLERVQILKTESENVQELRNPCSNKFQEKGNIRYHNAASESDSAL